jgi:hypothetical protein
MAAGAITCGSCESDRGGDQAMTTFHSHDDSYDDAEPVSADAVIGAHWSVDAPTREWTMAAAEATAMLIRYLNHTTLGGRSELGVVHAPDLDHLVRGLSTMASRLPQLLAQLDSLALEFSADPTLYDDRRDRPGSDTSTMLSVVLEDARAAAQALAHLLNEAGGCSTHLGHDSAAAR